MPGKLDGASPASGEWFTMFPKPENSRQICVREAREILLKYDSTLKYSDVDFDFRDFGVPKTVIYVDTKQKLHFYMDDIFSMYSAHKLSPLILHAIRWHEGYEDTMYPKNANWTIMSRPEFLGKMRRKFNKKYELAETAVPAPELLSCLDDILADVRKNSKRMSNYIINHPVKISWRSKTKNPAKMGVADTDTFTGRVFLDPILAQAPPYVRMYVLLHEVSLIKNYDWTRYAVDKDKHKKQMSYYHIAPKAKEYIKEHGWRMKDE